ncbi:uncharacterized protein LOC128198188 [Bicyclus anynana]|uniref:Uncharacterized protein LOC128198188 n=1 Tax=Bicyclus anynana TaxID=110368 RepID=A0ABM3LGD6_BICAN|nr:uncharacterized protein LOC128198188 [Bicyclus anynana]
MQAQPKKYIPQAGTGAGNTGAGESRPLEATADDRGCPSYSGGGKVLLNCYKQFARSTSYSGEGQGSPNMETQDTQAHIPLSEDATSHIRVETTVADDFTRGLHLGRDINVPKSATPGDSGANPFVRGGAVKRSPPTKNNDINTQSQIETTESNLSNLTTEVQRTRAPRHHERRGSLGSAEGLFKACTTRIRSAGKRLRNEEDDEDDTQTEIMKAISRLTKITAGLVKIVGENANTRSEIKIGVRDLKGNIEYLNKMTRYWEDSLQKPTKTRALSKNSRDVEIQTTDVEKDEEYLKKEIAIQTDDDISENKDNSETRKKEINLKEKIQKCNDIRSLTEIIDQEWPEESFRTVKIEKGNPLSLNKDWDLVVIARPKPSENHKHQGIRKLLKTAHPEALELLDNCEAPTVEYTIQTSTSSKKGIAENEKWIYVLPYTQSTEKTKEVEYVYRLIQELTNVFKEHGRTKNVAIAADKEINKNHLRKILEKLMAEFDFKIKLLVEAEDIRKGKPNYGKGKGTETLIVKAEGSYADILKKMKANVTVTDMKQIGVEVKSVRKSNDGKVLMRVAGNAEALRNKLQGTLECAEVGIGRETIFHITGLDEDISTEELKTALETELKVPVQVKSIRPTQYGSKTATVSMSPISAKNLSNVSVINIGWTRCRLRKRVYVEKCYKCWETGHRAAKCNGPDRSNCCRQCSRVGHKADSCTSTPFCPHCDVLGHKAATTGCPKFRGAINEAGQTPHDLLLPTVRNHGIDLVILAEPNNKYAEAGGWERDRREDAAIIVYNKALTVGATIRGNGFIGFRFAQFTVYSCYISPNCSFDQFRQDLEELSASVRLQRGKVLVAGDFNAASTIWGSKTTNKRGQHLMDIIADLDLSVANTGNTPTFERGGKNSRPDITMANSNLAGMITGWEVLDEESASGHKYITYSIGEKIPGTESRPIGWNFNKIDKEKFENTLISEPIRTPFELVSATTKACNQAMPKRKARRKKPVYWWNNEINIARKQCLESRRAYTRANSKINKQRSEEDRLNQIRASEEARNRYKTAKLELQGLILKSKGEQWKKVGDEVDNDPWGLGYKIVTKKINRSSPTPISLQRMKDITAVLFPTHDDFTRTTGVVDQVPRITDDELAMACDRIKSRKAPGPDEIAPEIVKLASKVIPDQLRDVMNGIFLSGEFPDIWKTARLILLRKHNKSADEPSGYRPLCLLDCYGKLLERILLNRIEQLLPKHGGLAKDQFGFRSGRSTLDAIERVKAIALAAKQGSQRTRKLCTLVALDVRNAFNSAPWILILEEFKRRKFPDYVINLISSYLNQRNIIITDAAGSSETIRVTSGVPQGSILGPTLWNILYDGVFKLDLGDEARLVGFADDLALVVAARTDQLLMKRTNRALDIINKWMIGKHLKLAPEKTEAIMLSGRKRHGPLTFNIDGVEIKPCDKLRYLGVWLDRSLRFDKHVVQTAEKAEKLAAALTQLMPRKGGPRASKRRLLASVAHSVMLYGAPVWSQALQVTKYNNVLGRTQRRLAIRICGAYRTVSKEAVLVIAGLIPIDKLATERARLYKREAKRTPKEERKRTLQEWSTEWLESGKGQWTRDLIQDLVKWVERKHGEVDKLITQALTGHGVFNTYLHAIGKANSECCTYCGEVDTPNHAIFECMEFEGERSNARQGGEPLTKANLVPYMLENKEAWANGAKMLHYIMGRRVRDEWDRQKENIEA